MPNKSLGQHWLKDRLMLEAIADYVDITPSDTVLEIGPGLGPLTALLVKRANRVVAVEFDSALAKDLPLRVPANNLQVIQGDILHYDLTQLPKGYKVAANVPYYITSKIVRLLLESPNQPAAITLLVQKEVAERLAAQPGEMSVLSVSAQYYSSVTLGRVVPAAFFTPPPEVDSQVVNLIPHEKQMYPDVPVKTLFRVVRAGFSERRKMLRSSLAGGLQIKKQDADALLVAAAITPDARAQELSLDQWAALTRAFLDTMA